MGQHLSPRYGKKILVSGYPILTAVNWSQHWCPICVHYQFSRALKLARKYEIEHWSWSSKTINWSADSFKKKRHLNDLTHEPAISSCDTGQWLSCFDICQLTILWMSNVKDVDLRRRAWETPSVQSVGEYVRTYVRTLDQSRDNQTKEVDHILWVWGSVPRAREARVGAPRKKTFSWFKSSVLVEPVWISLDNLTLFGLSN